MSTRPSTAASRTSRDAESPPAAAGRLNISESLLDVHLEAEGGDRTAVISGERRWSYRDVHEACCRAGNALRGLGIRRGDRVLLLLPDSIEWIAAFLGAARLGAIPVPANTWLPASDHEHILRDSGARVLIAPDDLLERLGPALESPDGPLAIAAGDGSRETGRPAFGRLLAEASLDLAPADTRADEPAFWLYSSGTTGKPKGVVHAHRSILHCADNYARRVLGIGAGDVTFSAAKLFFAYGMGNGFYFPFRAGGAAVLHPGRTTPAAAFEVIERSRPTVFFSVPSHYAGMLRESDAGGRFDLSSIRLCVSAGEPLPAEIYRRWKERFGLDILDGIGSTEMAHIFISNAPGRIRPGSTGEVVPGYEARIAGGDGRDLPDGEIGNLLVRGGSSFLEYWGNSGSTARALAGGWVETGDKYRRDAEGFFWYAGRSDDMLKVGGTWVSPFEVEGALLEHPAVLECAVIGIADENGLTKPKAFVVLRQGHSPTEDLSGSLQAFVKSRIAPYKHPRRIEFVSELPKTATGKVQRFKLRAPEGERSEP